MLYLLDANILITAHNTYYPLDRVPEFWSWLQNQGVAGHTKLPREIYEEILQGRDDLLLDWITNDANRDALLLQESVRPEFVRRVVTEGYGDDLTDDEVEQLGRDPFLIAYALVDSQRCVVTTEVSRPRRTRQNRHIPDVCASLNIQCCGPFEFNRARGFRTSWTA